MARKKQLKMTWLELWPVWPKLLRFLQEKEFRPVGGAKRALPDLVNRKSGRPKEYGHWSRGPATTAFRSHKAPCPAWASPLPSAETALAGNTRRVVSSMDLLYQVGMLFRIRVQWHLGVRLVG